MLLMVKSPVLYLVALVPLALLVGSGLMGAQLAVLGLTLGHYFIDRCRGAKDYKAWKFDGTRFKGDFDWHDLYDVEHARQKQTAFAKDLGEQRLEKDPGSPILEFLWKKAVKEWI